MCRWLAYSGSPVLLEELLVKPVHSLIDQSKHSRLGATTTNGDGFGVGWYGAPDTPGRVPRHRAGLERPQPPRHRRPHLLAAHLRPHSRLDRHRGPGDQLPSVSPQQLALDAQRRDPRLPARQARPRARGRPVALPVDRRIDRLGAVLLPRAHARARGQPAARRRAGRRPDRGDGPPPRRRAPDPDDGGDDGRRQHLGLPVLERARLAVAVLQHRGADPPPSVPGQPRAPRPLRRDAASCSRSRSATWPGRGTRCRSRAGASSSRGRTSCTRSRRGAHPEQLRDRPRLEGAAGGGVRRCAVGGLGDRAEPPLAEMRVEALEDAVDRRRRRGPPRRRTGRSATARRCPGGRRHRARPAPPR